MKFTLAGAKQRLSEIGSGRLDLGQKRATLKTPPRMCFSQRTAGKKSEKLGARLENCEKLLETRVRKSTRFSFDPLNAGSCPSTLI